LFGCSLGGVDFPPDLIKINMGIIIDPHFIPPGFRFPFHLSSASGRTERQ
jgi:hypothetical protein